ncbi:hypothetical protein EH165_12160 [Nakamurella antarctica]|uniref:Copper(I)-binding protein n=1 Tax=Nakamurella antarctica TaxID=1902245 RepID=A0A3G8ZWG3_9ACTN|nr:copper chaperone PCu(A)C [Nakamurella antarctica]AZI58774.1 hypothetical protein EH165_12160 [Nakamurella antarctica]
MARIAQYSRLRFVPAAGVALALVLSGCAAGQIAQTANQVAAVDGANGDSGKIGVRNVLLATAPTGGYPAGSDIPMSLVITNSALTADKLVSVSTPAAASVKVSGDGAIASKSLVKVGGDNPLTLTLTGLVEQLPFGHSIPMTFSFASGGTVKVNVPIEIPAERDPSLTRETVNILPAEHGSIWSGGTEGEAGH